RRVFNDQRVIDRRLGGRYGPGSAVNAFKHRFANPGGGTMNRGNLAVMAGAAAALLGFAGAASAQQRVVLYTSNEATLNKLIATEFQKTTGIEVNVISAGSGVIVKRVQTDKERPQGDPIWVVSRSHLQWNAEHGDPVASDYHNTYMADGRRSA